MNSFRIGTTQYGFPSTLNQGKHVKIEVDKDPAIENENLVTKEAVLQSSIQAFRKEMTEKGAATN